MWKESYVCRSLISQSSVSIRKAVTENRKCNFFRETFYEKKLVKLTNPDTRARVFILLFSNSFLFCFFFVAFGTFFVQVRCETLLVVEVH